MDEETNNIVEKFSSKKIYESFADILKYSNYKVLKCFNLVFSIKLFPKNIGSIIVLIYILIDLGCGITYIIKGIYPLQFKLQKKIKDIAIKSDIFNIKLGGLDKNAINNIDIYDGKTNSKKLKLKYPPRRKSQIIMET